VFASVGVHAAGQLIEPYASTLGQVILVAGAAVVVIAAAAVIFEFEGKANG
jgi:hypothetical protein